MMVVRQNQPNNWREYQDSLKRISRRKYLKRKLPSIGIVVATLGVFFVLLFHTGSWVFHHIGKGAVRRSVQWKPSRPRPLSKNELPALLTPLNLELPPAPDGYFLVKQGLSLFVETTLDMNLQRYINELLGRSLTHAAGVVVMRPEDGRILAMTSYHNEKKQGPGNICLTAEYPAASLFKIVSAAAAIEAKGFSPDKTLYYHGRKYTLYRKQLKKEKPGRYTVKTTLKRAFSKSINPVFGKIGIHNLGQDLLAEYGNRFLFNRQIPMDLALEKSMIEVPDDDFGLAEISSGFNKKTLISPLHATLITAAVANNGTMMEPWLVKRIKDASGKEIYRYSVRDLAKPIREETAKKMKMLMAETVTHGTVRRAFRSFRRKKKFKNVEIGAKTGTINDIRDEYKHDWLSAYVIPENGKGTICLTVLAIHGKKLGIRAKDLARHIISHYYIQRKDAYHVRYCMLRGR